MTVVTIKKPLLGELLGLDDIDNPGGDETVLSTIQVRYDQMFRELVRDYYFVVQVSADELEKVAQFNTYWYGCAKSLHTEEISVKPREEGLSDKLLAMINSWPGHLLEQCRRFEGAGPVLVHSPMLKFKQSRGTVKMQAWLRCILLPEKPEGA